MVCTISSDLLENIEKDELIYFSDLLMVFTSKTNDHKVTKDKKSLVIEKYENIKENLEYVKVWLDLMSFSPSSFEKIDVDLDGIDCNESFFVELCKNTNGERKMVVYSLQNIKKFELQSNTLEVDGIDIEILDRDTAKKLISNKTVVNGDIITNSQVAKENSTINKSKNE
ncbi:hypothetical protein P8625_11130 [Tenacibaculum tangerinum]|uniref:Uncharacterized protein n=1 Tax=Tenacibaculum tangerinum TaxID=3038772 RepID=A0ABY8L3Q5_9FLAO|nr:hypothetical protein [Tenacibaculum tangerinum]WGH74639.1 hypothetical protein P8625_11130 [Tenacibaculum tangerinum]